MADHRPSSKAHSITLGAILAWLVPGLGHWWIGERKRAVIFFIVISVTFWGGIAVGGVRSAVTAKENGLWIAAQLCTGPQSLFALSVSRNLEDEAKRDPSKQFKAPWPAGDIGVVYAGVAGLLNLLVILDVLSRTDAARNAVVAAANPRKAVR